MRFGTSPEIIHSVLLDFPDFNWIRHLNCRHQHIANGHIWKKYLCHHTTKHLMINLPLLFLQLSCLFQTSWKSERYLFFVILRCLRWYPLGTLIKRPSSLLLLSVHEVLSFDVLFRLCIDYEILTLNLTLTHDPTHCRA